MVSALQLLAGHIQFCSSFETRICQIFQQYFLIWVFCICWPTICGNQYKVKQVLRLAQGGGWMLELWHGFLIIANFVFLGEFWIADFHNFDWFSLDLSDVFPFSGATVCKAMTFQLHRMGFCHSGMINIISQNELSPVLIRVFPSRYQHLDSNRNSSASQYSTTAWKKLNEKVGRIQSMS